MNYYEHHLGDYAEATGHLSFVEDAAYSRMIRKYYATEKPLPVEKISVQRLVGARTKEERDAVSSILDEFFVLKDDGWHNNRCDSEIARFQDKQEKAKRSAEARWNKPKLHNERNANASPDAMRTHNECNAHQTPDTSYSEAKASGGEPPKVTDPDEIIFGYGVPLLTSAGNTDKHARSFLGGLRKQHGDQLVIDKLRECLKAKPLQPLEWLAAALPPAGCAKAITGRVPLAENFESRDYGVRAKL